MQRCYEKNSLTCLNDKCFKKLCRKLRSKELANLLATCGLCARFILLGQELFEDKHNRYGVYLQIYLCDFHYKNKHEIMKSYSNVLANVSRECIRKTYFRSAM